MALGPGLPGPLPPTLSRPWTPELQPRSTYLHSRPWLLGRSIRTHRPDPHPAAAPRAHASVPSSRATAAEGWPAPDRQSRAFRSTSALGPALWLLRGYSTSDSSTTVTSGRLPTTPGAREGSCQPLYPPCEEGGREVSSSLCHQRI